MNSKPSFRRPIPASRWRWPIALAALLVGLWLTWSGSVPNASRALDLMVADHVTRFRAVDQTEERLVVIDIDERSLAEAGPWPWRRDRIAALAENLFGSYRARAVALDFVLPEPGPGAGAGDERLIALAQHMPLVVSQAFDYVPHTPPLQVGQVGGGLDAGRAPLAPTVAATGFIGNFAGLSAARHVGNIGLLPDPDGAVRRLPLVTRFNDRLFLPLSLEVLSAAGTPAAPPAVAGDGFWTIPYRRTWASYIVIPAADILSGRAPVELVAGRIALVGSSSFGLADRVTTPLDRSTAGIMVHAAAVSALLDGTEPHGPPARGLATACLLLAAAFAAFVLPRLSAAWSVGALAAVGAVWSALVFFWIPPQAAYSPVAPLASLMVLLLLAVPNEWRLAQMEARRLIRTFEHYVAKQVLDELLSREGLEPLVPRLLEVTTLVADMEGYSALVEGAPLADAVELTRGFLDRITEPVLTHDGTLDKYIGDGLMSFWGAPLPMADHADRAVDAAIEMVRQVDAYNDLRQSQGKARVRVRVGIESGMAVAGDLGTPFRSVFTAVGDSVNMAARLQDVARGMPHDILLGPGAARLVRRHKLQSLGLVTIRGRKSQMEIFTLEGRA